MGTRGREAQDMGTQVWQCVRYILDVSSYNTDVAKDFIFIWVYIILKKFFKVIVRVFVWNFFKGIVYPKISENLLTIRLFKI